MPRLPGCALVRDHHREPACVVDLEHGSDRHDPAPPAYFGDQPAGDTVAGDLPQDAAGCEDQVEVAADSPGTRVAPGPGDTPAGPGPTAPGWIYTPVAALPRDRVWSAIGFVESKHWTGMLPSR